MPFPNLEGKHAGRPFVTPGILPTWTTDAPYRETVEEITRYRGEGILTVEMEAAALSPWPGPAAWRPPWPSTAIRSLRPAGHQEL